MAAVNVKCKQPFLQGVDKSERVNVILALDLLEAIQSAQSLSLDGISIRDLSAFEFSLVSYFKTQLNGLK